MPLSKVTFSMNPSVRLCLVLHNHQPVGNFDNVFQQSFEDSYLPFLEVFEPYEDLKISLHTSGPLLDWLDQHQPEYLDRLANLVAAGRIEIIGGAYYEPILPMLPSRDRIGQITRFSQKLSHRLGATVRGLWMPERVWEQTLVSDLAMANVHYTILDDYHFKGAGLESDSLGRYFITEDQGRLLKVFPGSETLRYLIPFRPAEETVDYLRGLAAADPGSVVVFGDDGEKFGIWPDTKKHVYEDGWLKEFFDALTANKDWLSTNTLAEASDQTEPGGKVYLPDASYREMTEWAYPVSTQIQFDKLKHDLENEPSWARIQPFLGGGFWRNFKVKYPETNEMYSRMMVVSNAIRQLQLQGHSGPDLDKAIEHLYRGQCNCPYWHGAFGGVYLPHLRNAIFSELIRAEKFAEKAAGKPEQFIEAVADDFNFDGKNELKLANDKLTAWIEPSAGGMIYELDLKEIQHNLLATLNRRPESYHETIKKGQNQNDDQASSIHDRVVFKQEGLEDRIQYDKLPRKSLIDHFWDNEIDPQTIANQTAMERGDFAEGLYQATIRRGEGRAQLQLHRSGNAWGIPLQITKAVSLEQGSDQLEISYLIQGLPQDQDLHFGIEFQFAGMPAGADDRFFHFGDKVSFSQLGIPQDLHGNDRIHLTDKWLGLDVGLQMDRPTSFWTWPVETVSQSEAGFEAVHQSVCVMPHWIVTGDHEGNWSVKMKLRCDCSEAIQRIASSLASH